MSGRASSLQAVLERQAAAVNPPAAQPALTPAPAITPAALEEREGEASPPAKAEKFFRPSRDGRRFLGGHFEPKVVRQMKILAAEEDTTTQALLEEALDLLFMKKGRGRIISS